MKQITDIAELRQIQISILDHIVEFCDNNHITYFLACGSLIGALRHKGYIPWDDDIDLFMPREEYNRLVASYNDPSGVFRMIDPSHVKGSFYTYAKVCDSRTLLIEDEVPGNSIGVYIDIFPLDYVTDRLWLRPYVFKFKKFIYRMRRCKIQDTCFLRSRFAYGCYRYFPLPLSVINRIIHRYFQAHKPTSTVCNMTEANFLMRECFPVSCTVGTIEVEFEGKKYKTMSGYHTYLTNFYGDYMQLPPVEQRIHHHFQAFWLE